MKRCAPLVRQLVGLAVMAGLVAMLIGTTGCKPKAEASGVLTIDHSVPPTPVQATPTGPTDGAVTLVFVKYDGTKAFAYPGYMNDPLHLTFPGISKKFSSDGFEEMGYINPGIGIRQVDKLFLACPGPYSMALGKEEMSFNPDAFTEIAKDEGETDSHAIMRTRDAQDKAVAAKIAEAKKSQIGAPAPKTLPIEDAIKSQGFTEVTTSSATYLTADPLARDMGQKLQELEKYWETSTIVVLSRPALVHNGQKYWEHIISRYPIATEAAPVAGKG